VTENLRSFEYKLAEIWAVEFEKSPIHCFHPISVCTESRPRCTAFVLSQKRPMIPVRGVC